MSRKDKILSQRAYSWNLITYCDKTSIDLLKSICVKYAIAYHDKDIKEDGSPKENHYHILVTFKQQVSLNTIKRKCDIDCNVLGLVIKDKNEEFLYLTHKNNKDKYQYSDDIIDTNSRKYWLDDLTKGEDDNKRFISDLLKLSPYEMAIRYGRDYIRNYAKYNDFKDLLLSGERFGYYKGLTGSQRLDLDLPLNIVNDIDDEIFGNND